MGVFLLTWNPYSFAWPTREEDLREFARVGRSGGAVRFPWSVARKQGIGPGDQVYLLRQSLAPRGIIAFGTVTGVPHPGPHWEKPDKMADYIDVDWSQAVRSWEPLPVWKLRRAAPEQHWKPQQSGIELRSQDVDVVSGLWNEHVQRHRR